jgi:hypothetical protein
MTIVDKILQRIKVLVEEPSGGNSTSACSDYEPLAVTSEAQAESGSEAQAKTESENETVSAKSYDVFSNQEEEIPQQTIVSCGLSDDQLSDLVESIVTNLNHTDETESEADSDATSEGLVLNHTYTFSVSKEALNDVGTYKLQDYSGTLWLLQLNADCSARMIDHTHQVVYYASWDSDYFTKCPSILFDDENPKVAFLLESKRLYHPTIIGNYLYCDEGAARAQNPRTRLVINKIS